MICPTCGVNVADGLLECPSCHAQLGLTQKIVIPRDNWCPVCGALLDPNCEACPKCGSPTGTGRQEARVQRKIKLPQVSDEHLDADGTGVITRIESAIPPETPDPNSPVSLQDRLPRTRKFLVAAACAIAVVGGLALYITHPWNSSMFDIRATTPADTSQAGAMDAKEQLSGQDGSTTEATDDALFDSISSDYEKLGELSERIDAAESAFDEKATSGTSDERTAAKSDVYAISIELSNLISDIASLDTGAGSYQDDIEHLLSLGNWLRNRTDALTNGWAKSVEAEDPSQEADAILSCVHQYYDANGQSSYKTLFKRNYEGWKPEQK